ncbi:hypothetical protein [Anaerostipes butyraticus]|uniref:Lipoprotein n=1 Tax=Anaerostipes butyraticus TaxID=645466 RepID=A0A916VDE5_9FIRM|nr:hypothetical protein [Anaerostipes butyraticus]GFO85118.1 hypothetical protein ANBU17_14650 [Anaerostipes butyraticus]HJC82264.1 hypothetical protein [Candidatus Anaerostipes avicola]
MKKVSCIFISILLIISLAGCSPDFNGSRTGNDSQFIMKYTAFNTTDSQDLLVEAGDKINAKIVIDGGHLSIKIQKGQEEPVYESENVFFSNDFDLDIEESGTYTVTVTGKKAKGSVRFVVENS